MVGEGVYVAHWPSGQSVAVNVGILLDGEASRRGVLILVVATRVWVEVIENGTVGFADDWQAVSKANTGKMNKVAVR